MNLIYYYSDSCGACKDYSNVVDRLSTELKITLQRRNIKDGTSHKLKGVPTVILEDGGEVKYQSVGNLSYEHLLEEVRKYIV